MINEETYNKMKTLIKEYESNLGKETLDKVEEPYIIETRVDVIKKFNPDYDGEAICKCGHTYYRHFDTYEDMENVGCKYCRCFNFKLKK